MLFTKSYSYKERLDSHQEATYMYIVYVLIPLPLLFSHFFTIQYNTMHPENIFSNENVKGVSQVGSLYVWTSIWSDPKKIQVTLKQFWSNNEQHRK